MFIKFKSKYQRRGKIKIVCHYDPKHIKYTFHLLREIHEVRDNNTDVTNNNNKNVSYFMVSVSVFQIVHAESVYLNQFTYKHQLHFAMLFVLRKKKLSEPIYQSFTVSLQRSSTIPTYSYPHLSFNL